MYLLLVFIQLVISSLYNLLCRLCVIYVSCILHLRIQSLNESYVPDVYDELLTQAEIQGHINNVNGIYTLI